MFTGIIQGVAQVSHIQDQAGLRTLRLRFPKGFSDGLQMGASVACDGVCLTVTQLFNTSEGIEEASFDVMQQTLAMTTLGNLTVGSGVHVERAAREGAEIGGHCLSGHIDFTASITQVRQPDNNHVVRIGIPRDWMQYLFPKGYLAIHGASLTMADVGYEADGSGWAEVWLIPETLRLTTFGQRSVGDRLNIEIERSTQAIVDTVTRVLDEKWGPLMRLLPLLQQWADEKGFSINPPKA